SGRSTSRSRVRGGGLRRLAPRTAGGAARDYRLVAGTRPRPRDLLRNDPNGYSLRPATIAVARHQNPLRHDSRGRVAARRRVVETEDRTMSKPVGVAILGCGYWGVNYVRVFGELADARVVTVCDQRVDRLQEVVRMFPGVQPITQLKEALQLPGVDAVVVCTNATTHHRLARECLQAGKHVLVEKPLTTIA